MASKKESNAVTSAPELERLRDILYGDYARTTEDRLGDLQKHVEKIRQELIDLINTKTGDSGSALNAAQTALNQRVDGVVAEQNATVKAVRQELSQRIDDLTAAVAADRRSRQEHLGQLLIQLGQQLIGEENGAGE